MENILIFFLGAIFASFIHLYVMRTLKGESIIKPRSHCDNCGHQLKFYELVPVISFIIQKGKCTNCKSKIGLSSLIAELLAGTLFVISYLKYGFTYETILGFVIAMLLISIIISDFKEMIILDSSLATALILITILKFLIGGFLGLYKGFLYGIFGFVLMFLIKIIGDAVFKKESLGGGDIKLAFLIGFVLPYQHFLIVLMAASFIALPYALYTSMSKKEHALAYGPFLMIGFFLAFLFQSEITQLFDVLFAI